MLKTRCPTPDQYLRVYQREKNDVNIKIPIGHRQLQKKDGYLHLRQMHNDVVSTSRNRNLVQNLTRPLGLIDCVVQRAINCFRSVAVAPASGIELVRSPRPQAGIL
jgi:hypothetical protein